MLKIEYSKQFRKEGIWDIHIRQNWLVFLMKEGNTITLLRTGTHASLGIG